MKLTCSQSDLNTNLSLVSRAVPSRPTHPILGNVLLVANQEKQIIELTGFDLSLGIRTQFRANIEEGGSLTLPAKLLNDIVSRLSEEEITLASEIEDFETNFIVTLTSISGQYQIRAMSAEEFPELPIVNQEEGLNLSISALTEGLKGTAFAASTDDTKQVLTGVHLNCNQNSLEFAATDGHRLAVVTTSGESEEENSSSQELEDFEVTIPARALRELEKILSLNKNNEVIKLHLDDSQVVFKLGDQILTTRKLEGTYPAYHKLIPSSFSRQITVERKRLIRSLELVAVLAGQKNNLVKFIADNSQEQLFLSVEAQDLGSAKESLSAQITGDDIEIAFNVKYFMDGLKALSTSEITMHLNEKNQPVILTPLGGLKMTYLVMPVDIKN